MLTFSLKELHKEYVFRSRIKSVTVKKCSTATGHEMYVKLRRKKKETLMTGQQARGVKEVCI